ncbi:hypothetical protein L6452_40261 [Arctium lappa]|uniref:Uncharacterized protein n=1 Tax=Arctium lappa TaxID=4217 RepID=A0ACB8XLF2_ARCLA|nr:hypothetical protein L6452_40261 [Arctium lappa]
MNGSAIVIVEDQGGAIVIVEVPSVFSSGSSPSSHLALRRSSPLSFCRIGGEMAKTAKNKSTERRDGHLKMEAEVRKWWDESDVFNAEAKDQPPKPGEKFFGSFPFPYMNGYLHLGHAFSLSKLEFAAAYHRLRGANVLLPFGFHCTGMPIKASADKLRREIEIFGYPPVFPLLETEQTTEPKPEAGPSERNNESQPDKFKGKKVQNGLENRYGEIPMGDYARLWSIRCRNCQISRSCSMASVFSSVGRGRSQGFWTWCRLEEVVYHDRHQPVFRFVCEMADEKVEIIGKDC